ncbi:hypothetical protein ACN4FE_11040 [Aliarcobacter butzleri]|uniref:hypothetical protein n=2 Tax=Aliarcobacter butzleri TaxID=28197 RepID=UPI001EDA4C90|nr:hypothetical protein [Aliarcobacter butzleri]MCG3689077.1 hypothetical protein [Aliarcobacter butzleri]
MNIFKKLFLILRNINNKIKDFEESIEKLKKDSQENTENKMIEVERKFEKMFIECKNKKDFTNMHYSTDFISGKLTKEEYDKKLIQFQKDVQNAIIKVENKEMSYQAFFDLVHFNKR